MSGHGQRRLASSKLRGGLTHHLQALRVHAEAFGRINSRDNYTFQAQQKRRSVYCPTGQQFAIDQLGLTRADAHRFRTYQGDKWPPAIVVNFSPPRISEHERDELDLAVLEFKEARAIAEVRMRCEYGR